MKQVFRIFFIVLLTYFVSLGNLFAQECRAVTDCSSGRCIATTVCGGGSQAPISEPRFQPLTLPAPLDVRLTNGNLNLQGLVDLTGRISGIPKVSDIRVNGTRLEVAPDSRGSFFITRALKEGVNEFELLVTDEFGRNYSSKTSVYRSPNSLVNALTEKRVALVIGNSAYKDQPLSNPVNDADDFSRLISTMGFSVKNLRNANIASMRLALREFGDDLKNSDTGLVFFAGHGVEVKGRNYLIPVGHEIKREDEIPDQSLDVGAILEKIETSKKSAIVILDACRNNPFGSSFRSTGSGLTRMDSPAGTLIAFSTSPGKIAADGGGRNSPYTKHLLKAMLSPNMPIEQVLKEVRREVSVETKGLQIPWENTSLLADFVFLKR